MNYRKLGKTELQVSEIGFGTWGIGGNKKGSVAYGPTDDKASKKALRRAYELGVTFYDTSDFYGYGHSEKLLGETLRNVRQEIIIATKVGLLSADGKQDFSSRHIRLSIEASLERLQTDYIDLYLLHSPPVALLSQDETILQTLESLKEEGKVRAIGISVRSPNDAITVITEFGIKAIQVNFNMIDQRILENGLLDLCQKENVGVIARTPFNFGFLTGSYSEKSDFHVNDHRSNWPPAQIALWSNAYQLFSKALAKPENQSQSQAALKFCLSYQAVSTVIPGMMTEIEVEENVAASQLKPFTKEELLNLEKIYQENTFFIKK